MIYIDTCRELKRWGRKVPVQLLADKFYRTESEMMEVLKVLEEKGVVIIEGEYVSLKLSPNKPNLTFWQRIFRFFSDRRP